VRSECNTKAGGGQVDSTGVDASADALGRSGSLIRELSIAQAIVDVATRHARGRTVATIELSVGREREVAAESLDFAFALLTEGTALDGAALEIEQVAGGELSVDALRLHDLRR
jgi:hypothetical protein